MRKALIASVVVGALAYAAPASAGCWATVDLSQPPNDIARGTNWTANLTVLQHGRYPLPDAADAAPTVTIANRAGEKRTFTAKPVDPAKGTYSAEVVFPSGGTWTYAVFDDFRSMNGRPVPCSTTHEIAVGGAGSRQTNATFVRPPTDGSPDAARGFSLWRLTGALGATLLIVLGVFVALRSRRPLFADHS